MTLNMQKVADEIDASALDLARKSVHKTLEKSSFGSGTAKAWVGDDRMREIEGKARADAETGVEGFKPPDWETETYAGAVALEMHRTVYFTAFHARIERNKRKLAQTCANYAVNA